MFTVQHHTARATLCRPLPREGAHQIPLHPAVVQSEALHCRTEQLGLKAWQSEVLDQLYGCLPNQIVRDIASSINRVERAKILLCKFERMERVSLLELAIWKASFLAKMVSRRMESCQTWDAQRERD
jgi:hypothetical protein